MVTVGDIAGYIEALAPPALAQDWDMIGLQVGRADAPVRRVLVCLDVDEELVDEAVKAGCQLIVSHHPLFFNEVTGVTGATAAGKAALKAIENQIAVYVAHTNLDRAPDGINGALADVLGLIGKEVLETTDRLLKLVVFVPGRALADVRSALGDAGAGIIGLYSHCGYASPGTGSFRPLPGADPSEGQVGTDNEVEEYRLEVEVDRAALPAAIQAMKAAHPYEEVAYDLYELQKVTRRYGLGMIGGLEQPMALPDFIDLCRDRISPQLRIAGSTRTVERVAVCGGSGASLIEAAGAAGADVFVTGDVRYHDAQRAIASGLVVIDAGHDGTELPGVAALARRLARDMSIEVVEAELRGPILRGAHDTDSAS